MAIRREMPAAVTDEFLVQQLRAGDAAAGDELIRRHSQSLLRYLNRLLGSEHLAEDLHQQSWLSALQHLDRFNSESSSGGFKAWLFRIATNKAHDLWRSGGRDKAARQGYKHIVDQEAPAAGVRMESSEAEAKLRAAIDQLPENQKQVVLLRYYSDMKFIEIAQLIGCPLNTALGRMHKAMLKLKQMLSND